MKVKNYICFMDLICSCLHIRKVWHNWISITRKGRQSDWEKWATKDKWMYAETKECGVRRSWCGCGGGAAEGVLVVGREATTRMLGVVEDEEGRWGREGVISWSVCRVLLTVGVCPATLKYIHHLQIETPKDITSSTVCCPSSTYTQL